jgi:hypothetical protein
VIRAITAPFRSLVREIFFWSTKDRKNETSNPASFFLALVLSAATGLVSQAKDGERGNIISITGTIKFIDIEGGFYGFIADSGERYLPVNLDEQYKFNNTNVRTEGKILENVMTTTMWGTPLEILKIVRMPSDGSHE